MFFFFHFRFPEEEVAESGEDRGEPVNHRVAVVSFSNCDASEARRGRLPPHPPACKSSAKRLFSFSNTTTVSDTAALGQLLTLGRENDFGGDSSA